MSSVTLNLDPTQKQTTKTNVTEGNMNGRSVTRIERSGFKKIMTVVLVAFLLLTTLPGGSWTFKLRV